MDAQTQATLARLTDARYAADRDTLRELLDRPDNLPVPTRRGGLLYNFWRDAAQPRGLWRRTTLESFRTDAPDWDILLDLDALAAAEGEDWVWGGAGTLPPEHRRAILRLSRGGSDAVVLREFDLERREFVPDGFSLPEAKSGTDWLDQETLLLHTALAGMTNSGYARTVQLWRRGEDWSAAPVLFETDPASMGACGRLRPRRRDRLVFIEQLGFFDTAVWIGDSTGPKQRIELPSDAELRLGRRLARGQRPHRHGRPASSASSRTWSPSSGFDALPRRRSQLHRRVRAVGAPGAAAFLLARRTARHRPARRSAAGIPGGHARAAGSATELAGLPPIGTVSAVAARHRVRGERRHAARRSRRTR